MYLRVQISNGEYKMQQISLSIEEAAAATGIGRTKLYQKINSGELPAKKLGKKTLILQADLEVFLAGLGAYPAKGGVQ